MGRELSIDRIDFMKDGSIVLRDCSDYFICGRTDFTNAIANLFYNEHVNFLILDYDEEVKSPIHVKGEPGSSWEEFDMEYSTIDLSTIHDVCREYIQKDEEELERQNVMLNDAYCARRNTRTLDDFKDFTQFIDDLEKHKKHFTQDAKLYQRYVDKVNLCHNDKITKCFVLLSISE